MRTKLFPDEVAESLDDLEYHPHHVHAPGTRATGAAASVGVAAAAVAAAAAAAATGASGGGGGSGPPPPTAAGGGVLSASEAVGGGGGAGTGNGEKSLTSPAGDGTGGVGGETATGGLLESGTDDGSTGSAGKGGKKDGGARERRNRSRGGGGGGEGTMIQRMNKTFRPDPLGAYTGDRSTLRFKPKRQEGLTTLRPRQQRTIFDSAQISPMLQVSESYKRKGEHGVAMSPRTNERCRIIYFVCMYARVWVQLHSSTIVSKIFFPVFAAAVYSSGAYPPVVVYDRLPSQLPPMKGLLYMRHLYTYGHLSRSSQKCCVFFCQEPSSVPSSLHGNLPLTPPAMTF